MTGMTKTRFIIFHSTIINWEPLYSRQPSRHYIPANRVAEITIGQRSKSDIRKRQKFDNSKIETRVTLSGAGEGGSWKHKTLWRQHRKQWLPSLVGCQVHETVPRRTLYIRTPVCTQESWPWTRARQCHHTIPNRPGLSCRGKYGQLISPLLSERPRRLVGPAPLSERYPERKDSREGTSLTWWIWTPQGHKETSALQHLLRFYKPHFWGWRTRPEKGWRQT